MGWEAVGAIAEGLAALAVVVSLLYVGRQFRHSSTQSLQTIYFQTVNNLGQQC